MGINGTLPYNRKAKRPFFILLLTSLAFMLLLSSFHLSAAEFNPRLSTEFYTQIRKNTIDENEMPFLDYMSLGASIESFDLDVDLKVMGDPLAQDSDFDLYSTRLSVRSIGEMLSVTLGRQNVLSGFSYDLMDGIDVLFEPDFYVNAELYAGAIRFIELDEFRDYNLAGGARLFLNKVSYTELSIEFRYERLENGSDWTEIGFLASRVIPVEIKPKIYASLNGDITNKLFSQATIGASISPNPFTVGFEVSRYDYKLGYLDPWEDIFSLFATSAMWEFKQSAGCAVNDNLTLFESYSLTRYNYDLTGTTTGHVARIGSDMRAFEERLRLNVEVFFNQSFGGRSYGSSGRAKFKITEAFFAGLRGGVLRFEKITGESDNASFFLLEAGYEIIRGLEVILGGEFNSNDQFQKDFRGNLAIKYEFL